tara:strand:- start:494 stop:1483 length:990 start_codon:yes stop_codon:yes gene_type:complete
MPSVDVAGEFETIKRLLAPLAHPEWGRGLNDDVAVVPSRAGYDLVLTKDSIVEGVHFLAEDPMDTVAQKLLRVNLSDLAAKGAEPFGYLLGCFWSSRCGWPERKAFVAGLEADQTAFEVALLGGDTVTTPGPASFSLTLLGWIARGRAVGRDGARPGDVVLVTGAIGDGYLGLQAARGMLKLEPERLKALIDHYRTPMPRIAFAEQIRDRATAAIDVSDGLVADLGHLAAASDVALEIDLGTLPVSAAGHVWLDGRVDALDARVQLASGGDDYEIAFTARAGDEAELHREAARQHLRLTTIGRVVAGTGVTVRAAGAVVPVPTPGWTHR